MKKSDNIYFALLRSALWGNVECDATNVDWDEVIDIACRQTTLGLICDVALRSKAGQFLPEAKKAVLRQQLLTLAMSHHSFNATIARIVKALRDKGIESVLMKGQGLAANYPVAELRQCGDIDLYVGKENYEAACALADTLASEAETVDSSELVTHYHIVIDGIEVEIHRLTSWPNYNELDAIYDPYSEKGMAIGSSSMMINGVNVWLPADTFNALFVFLHAWKHFIYAGIGFRQMCDWTMLLHAKRDTIDRDELADIVRRLRLMDGWQVFGCIAVDWLGLPTDEMPFYDAKFRKRAKRAVGMILKEGNFGHEWSLVRRRSQQTGMKHRLSVFLGIQVRQWRLFWVFPKIALHRYREEMRGRTKKNMGRLATKIRKLWTK